MTMCQSTSVQLKGNLSPLTVAPPAVGTTNLLPVFMDLSLLDTWNGYKMWSCVANFSHLAWWFKARPCFGMYHYFMIFYCHIIFHVTDIPHLFIHSLVDDCLGCSHFLAVIIMLLWTLWEIFCLCFLISHVCISGSGIVGWCGNSMFTILRNHQT